MNKTNNHQFSTTKNNQENVDPNTGFPHTLSPSGLEDVSTAIYMASELGVGTVPFLSDASKAINPSGLFEFPPAPHHLYTP